MAAKFGTLVYFCPVCQKFVYGASGTEQEGWDMFQALLNGDTVMEPALDAKGQPLVDAVGKPVLKIKARFMECHPCTSSRLGLITLCALQYSWGGPLKNAYKPDEVIPVLTNPDIVYPPTNPVVDPATRQPTVGGPTG